MVEINRCGWEAREGQRGNGNNGNTEKMRKVKQEGTLFMSATKSGGRYFIFRDAVYSEPLLKKDFLLFFFVIRKFCVKPNGVKGNLSRVVEYAPRIAKYD